MSDNLKITHPLDAKRINVNQSYEVRNWANKFDVTEDTLKAAVKACGTDSAADVARYLGKVYP